MSIADTMLPPYKGKEPYVFISYSHRNMAEVLGIIQRLQEDGYRVWYDEGIDPGSEWDENIAFHVDQCSFFIAFLSSEYLRSSNCKDELNYARDRNKSRLLVYLEDIELPGGMSMRLGRLQAIHKYKYSDDERFFEKLYATPGISIAIDKRSLAKKRNTYVTVDKKKAGQKDPTDKSSGNTSAPLTASQNTEPVNMGPGQNRPSKTAHRLSIASRIFSSINAFFAIRETSNGASDGPTEKVRQLKDDSDTSVDNVDEVIAKKYNGNVTIHLKKDELVITPDSRIGIQYQNKANLKSIYVSNARTIGPQCFSNCSELYLVILSENTWFIRKEAFLNCKKLCYVLIPSEENIEIDGTAFDGCNKKDLIVLTDNESVITFCKNNGIKPLSLVDTFSELNNELTDLLNYVPERVVNSRNIQMLKKVPRMEVIYNDALSLFFQKWNKNPDYLKDTFYNAATVRKEPYAQTCIGDCYYYGWKDYPEAIKWYSLAYEQGDSYAAICLGNCYIHGHGVLVDYAKALKYYSEASKDNAVAQGLVGVCYFFGIGTPIDYSSAAKWLECSANNNVPGAEFLIGYCYHYGLGVPVDAYLAYNYYRQAAEHACSEAQFTLANWYSVLGKNEEAAVWYHKASNNGYLPARAALQNSTDD